MLELCARVLSEYGAVPSVMTEIATELNKQMQSGNIAAEGTVTRAEAALTVWLARSLRDIEGTGFGVYNGDAMLWSYTPGTYTIRYSEGQTAATIRAGLYQTAKDGTPELIRLIETARTDDGWQITLPEGKYTFKAFLWDAGLSPVCMHIEI